MPRLHLHKLRVPRRARLQLIRRFLERCIERASDLPAKTAPLPSFVLGKLSGYLIELGTVTQLGDGFFLFGMFLALRMVSAWGTLRNVKKMHSEMNGSIRREGRRGWGRHTRICRALIALAGLSLELSSLLLEPLPFVVPLSPLLLLDFSVVLFLPAITASSDRRCCSGRSLLVSTIR